MKLRTCGKGGGDQETRAQLGAQGVLIARNFLVKSLAASGRFVGKGAVKGLEKGIEAAAPRKSAAPLLTAADKEKEAHKARSRRSVIFELAQDAGDMGINSEYFDPLASALDLELEVRDYREISPAWSSCDQLISASELW